MLEKPSDPIEFVIAPPFLRRAIAIAFGVAPFAACAIWFPFAVGFTRFCNAFTESSLGWLLYLMLLTPAAFFLRLAFPPRSAMSRLQVRHDGVSFVPGKWVRRYLAQPVVEAPITSRATEILLRQKGLSTGYAVIVRSAEKREKEVYAGASLTLHSAEEAQKITQGISAVTGLPVRLVIPRKLANGFIEEAPWVPSVFNSEWQSLGNLAIGSLPIVGGAITGYLVTQPAFVLAIGLGLWFAQQIAVSRLRPRKTQRDSAEIGLSIANFFLFGVSYSVTAVIIITIVHRH